MPRGLKIRVECISLVKQRMAQRGFRRQIDLAERTGISQSTIHTFLNCKKRIDYLNFLEICNVLDFEIPDIADYEALDESEVEIPTPQINVPLALPSTPDLEYPDVEIALDSPFYINRPPIEQRCFEEISRPGALIRIKAPQHMGKSSLRARILQQAVSQGSLTVIIDFQFAEEKFFSSLDTFLLWFCDSIAEQVAGDNRQLLETLMQELDEHWKSAQRFGEMKACKNYFERYLFPKIEQPLVLGLETVDRLFEYPKIYRGFFALLRAVHEEAKRRDIWKKLRLAIAYSTEAYVPVDINQSPFNVGLPVELPEFTHEQVKDLARRHQLNWSDTEVKSLMDIVEGHPFLVHLALYKIAIQEINLAQLLQTAATAEGIYSKHLQHQEYILKQQPELWTAIQKVVNDNVFVLNTETRFKLQALGLVKLQGDKAIPRCKLYCQYFSNFT